MSVLYYRVKADVCSQQIKEEINDALGGSPSPICEFVRIDDLINLTISFTSALSTQEELDMDSIITDHVCVAGGVDAQGEEFDSGLSVENDEIPLVGNVDSINFKGTVAAKTPSSGKADVYIGSVEVKNVDVETLIRQMPVHVTGTDPNGVLEVIKADASDPDRMPAHGILEQELAFGEEGLCKFSGEFKNVNTLNFEVGDEVWVAPGGYGTNTRPTGAGNQVQKIAKILKADNVGTTGSALIFGTGRANETPNITNGKVWMGDSNDMPRETDVYTEAEVDALLTGYVHPDPHRLSDGTNGAPAYSFANATDTGWWREPTGDVALTVDGTERFEVQTDGRVIIPSNVPNYETLVTADNVITNKKYVDDHMWPCEQVNIDYITNATITTLHDLRALTESRGILKGGNLSVGDSPASITVAAGDAIVREFNIESDPLYTFSWNEKTLVNFPTDITSFVYAYIDTGTVVVNHTTTPPGNDDHSKVLLGAVYHESTSGYHFINNYKSYHLDDTSAHIIQRFQETEPFGHVSGAKISETGTRNIIVTSGRFWEGLNQIDTPAIDTSVSDTFVSMYRDGSGGWTLGFGQTTYDNAKYDDGTGTLATLSAGNYGIHWVYLEVAGNVFLQYGTETFGTINQAQDATAPTTIHPAVEYHARLIGRIIFQEGASNATQIDSAFNTTFTGSTITDHDDLIHKGNNTHAQIDTHIANTDTHIDHSAVTLTAGDGLSGGGDITASRTFSVNTQNSIEIATDTLQLVGDVATPGNDKIYGTNSSGVKGWYGAATSTHPDPHRLSDGSNTAPTYSFANATDTGWWRKSTGDISLTVDGTNIFEVQTDGRVIIASGISNYENLVTADDVIPNKKYVDDAIVASGIDSFGSYYADAESDGTSSTTSSWYNTKLTLVTSSLSSGKYRIGWYCEVNGTSTSGRTEVLVEVSGTEIGNPQIEHEDTRDWSPYSGFRTQNIAGIQTITLKWRRQGSNHTASIRKARLEIWRIN